MDLFSRSQKISLCICTPWPMVNGVHEPMSPLWYRHRAGLSIPTNFNYVELFADGLQVDDARNRIARVCLDHDPRPEFLFFLDYDVLVPRDALTKLFYRARCYPDYDVYSGVYCCKGANPPDPLIYTEPGAGAYWDWAVGDLLRTDTHGINAVHSGLTLIRTSLFQRLLDKGLVHGDGTDLTDEPWYLTVNRTAERNGANLIEMSTEDIYFHDKARQIGAKILVDTSVLAGHLDKRTGVVYGLPYDDGPARRAKWMRGKDGKEQDDETTAEHDDCEVCTGVGRTAIGSRMEDRCSACKGSGKFSVPIKLALDIGAGGTRREWSGHRTYTLDIRPDTKPDYCQDTRLLNLPDNHYDLVASSHHLEHLGRWDQETVWAEMFRVLRPGGAMEHVVPNVAWAAYKITQNQLDEHVWNVLYGAQEAHGYAREYNTHYFGYTPEIARGLAEGCGLVDVEVKDWRQEPELGYNLVIRGNKPRLVQATERNGDHADHRERSTTDAPSADGHLLCPGVLHGE